VVGQHAGKTFDNALQFQDRFHPLAHHLTVAGTRSPQKPRSAPGETRARSRLTLRIEDGVDVDLAADDPLADLLQLLLEPVGDIVLELVEGSDVHRTQDRKSTRLNSS